MFDGFTAKPLTTQRIDQAYPVIRTALPDLTMERWRAFASAAVASDGTAETTVADAGERGIMTVQNDRGYILGLFTHEVRDDLRHGRVLHVDHPMVIDLFDSGGAMEALVTTMERLALALGCHAIHTDLPVAPARGATPVGAVSNWLDDERRSLRTARLVRLLGEAPCRPLRPQNPEGGA